jgi:hypothetical protein
MSAPQPNRAPTHRFPWRTTGVIVIVVVAASVIAGLLLSRTRVAAPVPAATASATPAVAATQEPLMLDPDRQATLLVNVRDDDRKVMTSVLIGVGGSTDFTAELTLPPDLLLPTDPPLRLEDTTDPTGAQTAKVPLETLLGVRVDAILDLDRLAWGGMVDLAQADLGSRPTDTSVAIPLLLDRVLAGLPHTGTEIAEVLTGLGSMARTTVPNQDMSELLAQITADVAAGPVQRDGLPVVYLRSGDDRAAVLDDARAEPVLAALFPEAQLEVGHPGPPRVVMVRSGATAAAVQAARVAVADTGAGVVIDTQSALTLNRSRILIPDSSDASQELGAKLAAALDLPATAIRVSESAEVDATVVLGTDRTWRTAP